MNEPRDWPAEPSRGSRLTRTMVVSVVEVNRTRLVELDSLIAAFSDAVERHGATELERIASAVGLLSALRALREQPLPPDAGGVATVPLELAQHRESCTALAVDPEVAALGCTCDLGHTAAA